MNIFNRLKKPKKENLNLLQSCQPFSGYINQLPLNLSNQSLFDNIRSSIPIIDAAINKLVRLIGSFSVTTLDPKANIPLNSFLKNVKVGPHSTGIDNFISCYFDSMLTYGNAIGEIVLTPQKNNIYALYNASLKNIKVSADKNNPLALSFLSFTGSSFVPIKFPQLILFSALNPQPGQIQGTSLLNSLPFISNILIKIYKSIALNFDRVGNIRFAVTYKPSSLSNNLSSAKEIANNIANEWSSAMNSDSIKDFIAVGDVDIKVIGSDNQILDTNIPVRQMLEQIVAKTGIPPFLLGLSWSTSERMSKQQAEILTSELESYRRNLSPIISKIVSFWLRFNNFSENHTISWNPIHLHDEVELARASLISAQAQKLSKS